jgi:hypothetical protein
MNAANEAAIRAPKSVDATAPRNSSETKSDQARSEFIPGIEIAGYAY